MEVFLWFAASVAVIGLVIGGLMVVYYKAKAPSSSAPREGDRGFEREARLFQLFQNIEDMMDGFDSYVEETQAALEMEKIEFLREKEEITRMHAQVLALLGQFREEVQRASETVRQDALDGHSPMGSVSPSAREEQDSAKAQAASVSAAPKVPERPALPMPVTEPVGARAVSIWNLYCEGKTSADIARELGMSQTEVGLTLKLLTGGKM